VKKRRDCVVELLVAMMLTVHVLELCYILFSNNNAGALPCNEEVPVTVNILGCSLYPKCAFCAKQEFLVSEQMQRS
jgi:hypothetical protein